VRVEAPPTPHEGQLVCASCGGPLNAREGRFALKYFRVGGSQRYPLRPRKWRQAFVEHYVRLWYHARSKRRALTTHEVLNRSMAAGEHAMSA
jgi:hypothetical protein